MNIPIKIYCTSSNMWSTFADISIVIISLINVSFVIWIYLKGNKKEKVKTRIEKEEYWFKKMVVEKCLVDLEKYFRWMIDECENFFKLNLNVDDAIRFNQDVLKKNGEISSIVLPVIKSYDIRLYEEVKRSLEALVDKLCTMVENAVTEGQVYTVKSEYRIKNFINESNVKLLVLIYEKYKSISCELKYK